ncbi:hypothetical protein AGMMS49921_03450 [Endomicrobiia bacterium]|nr:hypothetical protein AGMMS49921_03450 [Endomicrobiia bacterium]
MSRDETQQLFAFTFLIVNSGVVVAVLVAVTAGVVIAVVVCSYCGCFHEQSDQEGHLDLD